MRAGWVAWLVGGALVAALAALRVSIEPDARRALGGNGDVPRVPPVLAGAEPRVRGQPTDDCATVLAVVQEQGTGTTLAGVPVRCRWRACGWPDGGFIADETASTDAKGEARFGPVPVGDGATAELDVPGHAPAAARSQVAWARGQGGLKTAHLTLVFDRSIRGVVKSAVSLMAGTLDVVVCLDPTITEGHVTASVQGGSFVVHGLPPGRSVVLAATHTSGSVTYRGSTVAVAGESDVHLVLGDVDDHQCALDVKITDMHGAPIALRRGVVRHWSGSRSECIVAGEHLSCGGVSWPYWLELQPLTLDGVARCPLVAGPFTQCSGTLQIEWPEGLQAEGRVVTEAGIGIEGVLVRAFWPWVPTKFVEEALAQSVTSSNGAFSLPNLPRSPVVLAVSTPAGYQTPAPIDYDPVGFGVIAIEVASARAIRVVDANGHSLPGIRVGAERWGTLTPQQSNAVPLPIDLKLRKAVAIVGETDANGVASIGMPGGLLLVNDWPLDANPRYSAYRDDSWSPERCGATVVLRERSRVHGVVRDPAGSLVPHAWITLWREDEVARIVQADANGQFEVWLDPIRGHWLSATREFPGVAPAERVSIDPPTSMEADLHVR